MIHAVRAGTTTCSAVSPSDVTARPRPKPIDARRASASLDVDLAGALERSDGFADAVSVQAGAFGEVLAADDMPLVVGVPAEDQQHEAGAGV